METEVRSPGFRETPLEKPLLPGQSVMCILDRTGDTKVIWDSRNQAEVDAAKAQFDALKKAGYIAYTVNKDGTSGEVIREFDPKAEKIILSPPVAGG